MRIGLTTWVRWEKDKQRQQQKQVIDSAAHDEAASGFAQDDTSEVGAIL